MTPSLAREAFDKNLADVSRLLEIHRDVSGDGPGRKYGVDVLNRSAVVLLCASWEAYCEDIVGEVVAHFTEHAPAKNLPKKLREQIADEFGDGQMKMKMWSLADDGWKSVLSSRLDKYKEERDRGLNTPKPEPVKKLFLEHAGYEDITQAWTWPKKTAEQAAKDLIALVELRGSIAHRVDTSSPVNKGAVERYMRIVGHLVEETDKEMQEHALRVTGVAMRP